MPKDPGALLDIELYNNRYKRLVESMLAELDRELISLTEAIRSGRIAPAQKAQVILAERQRILDFMTGTTTENLNQATEGAYKRIFNLSDEQFKAANINAPFLETDLDSFTQLKNSDYAKITTQAQFDANTVWENLFRWSLTGNESALAPFTINMDQLQISRYADTVINTHIDTFNRTVNGVKSLNAGITRYRYDGPPPERGFCRIHYQKVYTLDEISTMDNGQIGDVFFSAGGYNCRHWWTPIP
jgi:hypothetical protein